MAQPTISGIFVDWSFIKNMVDNNALMVHYTEDDKKYNIQIYNGPTLYKTQILKDDVSVGGSGFDQTQNDLDRTDFLTNYAPNANGLETTAIRIENDQQMNVNVVAGSRNNKYVFDANEEEIEVSKNNSYVINFTGYCKGLRLAIGDAEDSTDKVISEVAYIIINGAGPKLRLQKNTEVEFEFDYKLKDPSFTLYAGSKKTLKSVFYYVDGESE